VQREPHAENEFFIITLDSTVGDDRGTALHGLHFLAPFLHSPYTVKLIKIVTFMSNPEHSLYQPREVFAPDTGVGSGPSDSIQGNEGGAHKDYVVSSIRGIQEDTTARTYFELVALGTTNLLSALEKSDVLPYAPEDPNPFNVELDEAQHEHWWSLHPEEAKNFTELNHKRKETLDILYLGTNLNRLSGGRIYRSWSLPSEFTTGVLSEFLKLEHAQIMKHPFVLEFRLKDEGLLAAFGDLGILPPTIANQFKPQDLGKLQDERQFSPMSRNEVLADLHIGALLNILFKRLYP
jgi:hypothetical protein